MNDKITLTLNRQELNQLLEGLSERAENWEEISESLREAKKGKGISDSRLQPRLDVNFTPAALFVARDRFYSNSVLSVSSVVDLPERHCPTGQPPVG